MRKLALIFAGSAALFLAALHVAPAHAESMVVQSCGSLPQQYAPGATRLETVDRNGNLCTTLPGGGSGNPTNTPIAGSAQYNVAVTSSTALTVPAGATYAVVQPSASVNVTYDGTTPTASLGNTITALQTLALYGNATIVAAKFIQVTPGATITVSYFK